MSAKCQFVINTASSILVSTYKISTPGGEGLGEYPKDSHHRSAKHKHKHKHNQMPAAAAATLSALSLMRLLICASNNLNSTSASPIRALRPTRWRRILSNCFYCTSVSSRCNRVDPRRPFCTRRKPTHSPGGKPLTPPTEQVGLHWLWFGTVPIRDGLSARKTKKFGIIFSIP